MALAATVLRVPLSRFTSGGSLLRLGGGSAQLLDVRQHEHANVSDMESSGRGVWVIRHVFGSSDIFEHSKAKI